MMEVIQQLKDTKEWDTANSYYIAPKLVNEENSAGILCVKLYGMKIKWSCKRGGVLSLPGPKPEPSLPLETVDIVHAFYEHDDISRVMPGK